jgi:Fe-S cluster assembly ATP-binding protein
MLKIKNLTAQVQDQILLNDINLEVNSGELHAIMGPKNSGKSNLVYTILGVPTIEFKEGSIFYKKKSIANKNIYQRNIAGIFVAFQHPPIIDGVTNFELTKSMLKAHKDTRTANEIENAYKELCKSLGLSTDHGRKVVNHEILTMTECKKNEILHMLLLNPDLIVLDEIDAEVHDEELEIIAIHIKAFLLDKSKSAIVVTHSQTLLDMLQPTHVHVMVAGEIRETGSTELYTRIVEDGYTQFS